MPRKLFILSAVAALLVDQASKLMVLKFLPEGMPVNTIGHFIRFVRTRNPDGIFGLRFGPPFIYYILPLLGMGLVIYFAIRTRDRWYHLSYGLVLGGALGNLIDRIRLGYVVDFIDVGLKNWRWYTFNPADGFVVIGVILLLYLELIWARRRRAEAEAEPVEGVTDEADIPG